MVQYVFTPWRNRQELLLVRQQFYSTSTDDGWLASRGWGGARGVAPSEDEGNLNDGDHQAQMQEEQQQQQQQTMLDEQHRRRRRDQHDAVARVSMWMQRGGCPHMVESTALLTAAVLSDEAVASEQTAASAYAIRAAYSAAFSRFVTGLLDGHQDKQRKQSMYSVARTIGLPATFVELRHQSTHEQLPSRAKLRSAAKDALAWIWDYYWRHLQGDTARGLSKSSSSQGPCADAVLRYLREDDEVRRQVARDELRAWPRGDLLRTVAELQTSMPGNQAYLKCLRLSNELAAEEEKEDAAGTAYAAYAASREEGGPERATAVAVAVAAATTTTIGGFGEFDTGTDADRCSATGVSPASGWAPYTGVWKPKPIGMV